jgi:site-specific DNA-methyltransferase (cytosine-N4-specific)
MNTPSPQKQQRFTYGDQFSPEKFLLTDLLELCVSAHPDRATLQRSIRRSYFEGHGKDPDTADDNSNKMAMNCLLSLNAYGLINLYDKGTKYQINSLAEELIALKSDLNLVHRRFAVHILTEREGLMLARLIENIRARGEQVTLEYLGEEMNDLGFKIPPNSTYISTMRAWLAQAGVFHPTGYEINWDVIYDLLNVDADIIDKLYQLTTEQKYFLLSLVSLNVNQFTPSNKVANHTRSVYKVRLTTKNLVKDVLEPLEEIGLIETLKTTTGRGAKPHAVKLSVKGTNEILRPIIDTLAKVTELTSAEVNRPFEDVVLELDDPSIHVRGKALELFSVWIIRLLGLRFSKWRLRSYEATGGGEVDVLAASDKIVYSRWQIQCKNQHSPVGIDVITKEVGLTFLTKADIIMVVTTSHFARDAVNYANLVTDNSRYYLILLEGDDVRRIAEDRTRIVDILNYKARRTFAKRELGIADFGDELMEIEHEYESEQELEDAIATQGDRTISADESADVDRDQ